MEVLLSPAKVNIGLWIVEKRDDGYHNIFSFFHTIDLYDRIYIKPSHTLTVKSSTLDPDLQEEKNIVYKTVTLFEKTTGIDQNWEIFIEKNIPVGGGLGGGSSNAAVVLQFLNSFYKNPLSEKDLFDLSVKIGADAPFFLKGGFALAQGIGEKLTFFDQRLNDELFLIYPNIKSNTGEVYSKVDKNMLTNKDDLNIILNLITEYGTKKIFEVAENKLGEIAKKIYPEIEEVYNFLEYLGYKPFITGSGSTVYCVGSPSKEVETACKVRNWKLIKTRFK
ncbi:4-(cytidine 5'-diphospho)-2-C-methyl-D-erythritol kinase [Sulfurihydrogenibium azorense Az-Fu1]|uniref:4-diphosphocytidyl-2-C-methyl-D-erythritol kinase n=1 Tax=Sulfurihydrogenibium azorense (strain DSM 15241 / OCM 825 / Az-Fu1) TaxID=204536 RepID=C1DXV1_SULAA|nr:4-(cytidine 5'-diphospho)-2-C-methyl-D-erythritol kinase [Sulfurihydrogenibium azorense]ACN98505.1 4-(cytidine 5'-diphospho)-2-C-methyl-D-erythritol kinase [Sulfurihydrogenibium azorense Az-Fu1]